MQRVIVIFTFALLSGCLPVYEQHQIASIHAAGVVGNGVAGDAAYNHIESTLDGLSAIFKKRGFTAPLEQRTQRHGKRYEYGYYLTGERTYGNGFVYSGVKGTIVQCSVEIDRKKASLRFIESEWPQKSGIFPMTESQRQYIRETARIVADYLRRTLPSHSVQTSIDEQPPPRPNQAMQRTAGRSAFPLSMTATFHLERHAPSPAVADLGSR
jgi:hypothetical protein